MLTGDEYQVPGTVLGRVLSTLSCVSLASTLAALYSAEVFLDLEDCDEHEVVESSCLVFIISNNDELVGTT